MKELFPVQKAHAGVLLDALGNYGAALDASVTGAGKTLVACEVARQMKIPVFVVAPKVSRPMWERELEEHGCDWYGVTNYEMLRTGKEPYGTWAKHSGGRIWLWQLPQETLLIFDECQRAKGMNSQNARIMWSAKPYNTLMLSASAAKDPTEMKALGYLLGLHRLRDFWKWALRNGCSHGMFGGLQFSGTPEDLDALHSQIFPEHGSRLDYDDMAEYFQATEINMTPLDFGPEIKQVYEHMATELAALDEKKQYDSSQAEVLTIRLRARQKVELLKVPYIFDMTNDLLAEGRSVVLFVNFTQTLEALRDRISNAYDVGIIAGIDIKNRQKYIDDFAEDRIRVMICNVQAGGVSVNLHDRYGKYPRVSIISPADNEKDILQCVGRIHRAGGATPTQQHILFAAGTIEEEVKTNCETKLGRISIFNEGLAKPNESGIL
jgi:Mimiviridae putative ATP-dependent RNA helicase